MPQKQLLQSAGDGTAVPQGYVGEKVDFTARTVTTANLVWRANTTPLATLNSGIYLIFATHELPGGTGNNSASLISSNSNNDSSGPITPFSTSNYQTTGAGGSAPIGTGYLIVPPGTQQQIFAKAFGDGNTPLVTIKGHAVRIA